MNELLENHIKHHISRSSTYSHFKEILDYATLPAGKLFRPGLACSIYKDIAGDTRFREELKNPNSAISLFAIALEIHHAYTLVHDDLPCMDDDDERRGKPSVHKQYGEYKAVLGGDALLHESHGLINKIDHKNDRFIRKVFHWSLGAKGLILGQIYDLSGVISQDFLSLLRTHELKTARLIQLALIGGYYLGSDAKVTYKQLKSLLSLGQSIGVAFQLLDDLSECIDELSSHEKEVSPFLNFPHESLSKLESCLTIIKDNSDLKETQVFLNNYLVKMKNKIAPGLQELKSNIQNNLGKEFCEASLHPLMMTL